MAAGELAPGHPEIERVVAPNPGAMTLEGTCTYLYGSDPCVVIDPGPDDPGHLKVVQEAGAERGGIGLILLTHSHDDHAAGAAGLAALAGDGQKSSASETELSTRQVGNADGTEAPLSETESSRRRGGAEVVAPKDGEEHAGLRAIATPGHAVDHICLLTADRVCFSGDLVLGEGSTFVPPDGGSLAAYMDSLRRMQAEEIELICPGHGPWVTDPAAKLAEYVEHREMREHRLLAALERGERSKEALLAEVWDDVPAEVRPAAAIVMEAHLAKLEAEGRLPDGVT